MNKKNYQLDCEIWDYCVICENLHHVDLGNYNTYGIKVLNSGKVIHDISTNKKDVVFMVYLFNKHQLNPIHLLEVIEDLL